MANGNCSRCDSEVERLRRLLIVAVSGASMACTTESKPETPAPEPNWRGCPGETVLSANLWLCDGQYVHRRASTGCALPPRSGGEAGASGAGNEGGAGGTSGASGTMSSLGLVESPCMTDSDCTENPNGYCFPGGGGPGTTVSYCIYPCTTDADCGAGRICACEMHQTREIGVCRPAECSIDADCGEESLCSSPLDKGPSVCGPLGATGFHCQTLDDECGGPADCSGAGVCTHDGSKYVCAPSPGYCGRPFIVRGRELVAPVTESLAWTSPMSRLVPSALPADVRAAISEHWARAGAMEHASIAAFARFTLQLLSLGAPAALVEASILAGKDEIRHAEICFALASRYAGVPLGPDRLPIDGALDDVDLLSIVDSVVIEGCLGETSAALEASFAAALASDEIVRRALERIAEDEARHATLAFRFIAWAAERDARVLRRVEQRVHDAAPMAVHDGPVISEAFSAERRALLAAHGVPDRALRADARHAASCGVVQETVRALAARLGTPLAGSVVFAAS